MGHRVPNAACRLTPDPAREPRNEARASAASPPTQHQGTKFVFVSQSVTSLNRAAEGRASELLRHISIVCAQ